MDHSTLKQIKVNMLLRVIHENLRKNKVHQFIKYGGKFMIAIFGSSIFLFFAAAFSENDQYAALLFFVLNCAFAYSVFFILLEMQGRTLFSFKYLSAPLKSQEDLFKANYYKDIGETRITLKEKETLFFNIEKYIETINWQSKKKKFQRRLEELKLEEEHTVLTMVGLIDELIYGY